ncbi:MAG: 2-polyprenyl-6-methoxyphenol hydroxylase, partial [Pseudonocardia sp.]|nr:2-polyprenyl-6-methoxyphenol hydroxylase [Pseudonocardia sp.]
LQTPLTVAGTRLPGRMVAVEPGADGAFVVRPLQQGHLHATGLRQGGLTATGARAPDAEDALPGVFARLAAAADAGVEVVAVHGGTSFTRTLVCEQARMHHGLTALLADPHLTEDAGRTAVLSGRADLVTVAP